MGSAVEQLVHSQLMPLLQQPCGLDAQGLVSVAVALVKLEWGCSERERREVFGAIVDASEPHMRAGRLAPQAGHVALLAAVSLFVHIPFPVKFIWKRP